MLEARVVKARRAFVLDVALHVAAGEALAVFGASGSGKSTLLSCLAGLEDPDDGFVRVDGATHHPPPLPLHRRGVGYLTQDAALFPHLSVAGNVRFGLAAAETAWVVELRERLELGALWNRSARELSGGQARRVALARTFARRPSLVLLDEPFTGLDRHVARALLADLRDWRARLGFAAVIVEHHAEIALLAAPRAIVLEAGRVVQQGAWAEIVAAPATPLTAELLRPL